jgi:hypothetical protein
LSSRGGRFLFNQNGTIELEMSQLYPLESVPWARKMRNESFLEGGELVTLRESVVVTSTPLGFPLSRGMLGGVRRWRKEGMEVERSCRG